MAHAQRVKVQAEAWTSCSLPIYRAYLFDKEDCVSSVHVVQAEDDRGAVDEAEELADGNDVEIWNGIRLVVRLANKSEPSG
jgi:hypothetical protein